MRDRREEICVRLVEIGETFDDSIKRAFRNLGELSEHERRAVRVYDGDENRSENAPQSEHRRTAGGRVMTMLPIVGLLIGERPEAIGSELNALRLKLVYSVETDATLKAICGANGGIQYLGLANNVQMARQAEGEMLLQFAISYPLIPSEMAPA